MSDVTRSPSKRTLAERLGYDPNAEHGLVIACRIHMPAEDQRNAAKATSDIENALITSLGVNYIVKTSATYRSKDGKVLSTYDVEYGRHKESSGRSLLQRILNSEDNFPLVLNLDVNFPASDDRLAAQAAEDLQEYLLEEFGAESIVFVTAHYRTGSQLTNAHAYEVRRYGEDNVEKLPLGI